MGKRTRRYETQFLTCLLVHGPIPYDDENQLSTTAKGYSEYRNAVMVWWHDSHEGTPPRNKSQWKFWRRYRTWYKVHRRRHHDDSTT